MSGGTAGPEEGPPSGTEEPAATPEAAVSRVRRTLLEYAERGVFRGFDVQDRKAGGAAFRFFWLVDRPFRLTVDGGGSVLRLENLLPDAAARPRVRSDVERLLRERSEDEGPEHRTVDRNRATVELEAGEGEDLVVLLRVREDAHVYGVRKLLNLANEIWVRLNDAHQRYLWEAFRAPME